jgi:hypothetical protein
VLIVDQSATNTVYHTKEISMDSVEILGRCPPSEYTLLGHITPGPGTTFIASALLVNAANLRIRLPFLPRFPHNTMQEARAQIESFAHGYGYSLYWDGGETV